MRPKSYTLAAAFVAGAGAFVALSPEAAQAGAYDEAMEICRMELQTEFGPESYRLRLEKARKSGRMRTLELQIRPRRGVEGARSEAVCVTRSGELLELTVTPA